MTTTYRKLVVRSIFSEHQRPTIEVRHPIPGLRHNTETVYVPHRFPVKGGITPKQYLTEIVMAGNPLLAKMRP